MRGTRWTATSTGSPCRSSACRSRRTRRRRCRRTWSARSMRTQFPHVVEVISHVMRSGRVEDFTFGLDLILDGLQRTLDQG